MNRYQFTPRAHVSHVDLDRARKAASLPEFISHVREAFPIMDGGTNGKAWRGTNQPRTIAFSAADDAMALIVAQRYGQEDAYVWNITEARYV